MKKYKKENPTFIEGIPDSLLQKLILIKEDSNLTDVEKVRKVYEMGSFIPLESLALVFGMTISWFGTRLKKSYKI